MNDIYTNSSLPPLTPQHRYSFAEDTDGSETDTVLDTPTSWTDLSPSTSPSTTSYPRWSLASAFSTAFSRHGISQKLKRHSELPHGSSDISSSRSSPLQPPFTNSLGSSLSSSSSSHRLSLFSFIGTQNNITPSIDSGSGSTKLELPPSPTFSTHEQKQNQHQQPQEHHHHQQQHEQLTHIMASSLGSDVAPLGNHELVRVARLLTTVYRFEASRHDHSPFILDFVNGLKTYLEDWAEHPITTAAATKRAIKHVGRRLDMADVVFNKAQQQRRRRRRRRRRRLLLQRDQLLNNVQSKIKHKKRGEQQNSQRRETGDDQERALMDAIHAAQAPLLTEVTELQRTLDGLRDEKDDVEQTLAEVQHELELVLEDLEHEKQQTVAYRSIITRLESHLHTVEFHDEQDDEDDSLPQETKVVDMSSSALMAVRYKETLERTKELDAESSHLRHNIERLKLERERQKAQTEQRLRRHADELERVRAALAHAEKRVAEGELRLEVAKSLAKRQLESLEQQLADAAAAQQEQNERQQTLLAATAQNEQQAHRACREVETALSREVVKREAQVAQLERTLQQVTDQQQRDRSAWEHRMRDELSAIYMQEKEIYKVQISRELRTLASQTAEQETEIESLERRYREAADAVARANTLRKQVEETCTDRMHQWEKSEQDLRTTILQLTQKISSLEYDSLQLYSRNIKLAHQLGQCAP